MPYGKLVCTTERIML